MSSLEVRGLCKAYGAVSVLEGLTLAIAEGERLVVLGPSGCGKTTLLRLIAGLDAPDAGEILLDGQLASRPGWVMPPHQRDLGVVFQTPALWPHMTVAEIVQFGLGHLDAADARVRVGELLAVLGLEDLAGRRPHALSGGEARRVALARALAPRPALLLMDEPLTNLNASLKAQVLDVLQTQLDAYRPTLVYVTHDGAEANAIVSRATASRLVTLPGRTGSEGP